MKSILFIAFWLFLIWLGGTLQYYRHFSKRLDRVLQERIALKDSVLKYRGNNLNWVRETYFFELHREKSIEMEVLFEKLGW